MLKILVSLSSILLVCNSSKYPSSLPQCIHGDNICLKNAINDIVSQGKNGLKELNLIPLDPLHVDFINIIQGENQNSPVNIALKLLDINVYGLNDIHATKFEGFEKDPSKSTIELHGIIPRLTISGNYKMKGQILVLPIQGNGKCNISFENSKCYTKFTLKTIQNNGKEYVQIDKFTLGVNPKKVTTNLENLFNGDKALGQSMNSFLNENWEAIFNEMKPVVDEAIGKIVKNIINNVFAKIPYNDLFIAN